MEKECQLLSAKDKEECKLRRRILASHVQLALGRFVGEVQTCTICSCIYYSTQEREREREEANILLYTLSLYCSFNRYETEGIPLHPRPQKKKEILSAHLCHFDCGTKYNRER